MSSKKKSPRARAFRRSVVITFSTAAAATAGMGCAKHQPLESQNPPSLLAPQEAGADGTANGGDRGTTAGAAALTGGRTAAGRGGSGATGGSGAVGGAIIATNPPPTPGPVCPQQPPVIGSACAGDLQCDYPATLCDYSRFPIARCIEDVWVAVYPWGCNPPPPPIEDDAGTDSND